MTRRTEEFVVTAFAAPARGPGWANTPVVVVVQERGGGPTRQVWLQPEQQSETMRTLYRISAEVSVEMSKEAARILKMEWRT